MRGRQKRDEPGWRLLHQADRVGLQDRICVIGNWARSSVSSMSSSLLMPSSTMFKPISWSDPMHDLSNTDRWTTEAPAPNNGQFENRLLLSFAQERTVSPVCVLYLATRGRKDEGYRNTIGQTSNTFRPSNILCQAIAATAAAAYH